ncbi:MAG: hypothetical protein QXK88_00405 [Desulfurococcaceae archaeon]
MKEARHYISLIAWLIIILILIPNAIVDAQCYVNSSILFYEYGQSSCPHCTKQHDLFVREFPRNNFFCEIDKYRECESAFAEFALSVTINVTGVPVPVPQTLVVKTVDNEYNLIAVVIGAVTDKSFWIQLSCREPSNEVPIYYGTNQVGSLYINETLFASLLKKLIVFPLSPSSGSSAIFIQALLIAAILIGGIGGYVAYIYLRRGKHKGKIR